MSRLTGRTEGRFVAVVTGSARNNISDWKCKRVQNPPDADAVIAA